MVTDLWADSLGTTPQARFSPRPAAYQITATSIRQARVSGKMCTQNLTFFMAFFCPDVRLARTVDGASRTEASISKAGARQSTAIRGLIVGTLAVVAGFAVPVLAAPPAAIWLRHLFSVFVREGAHLFGGIDLPSVYATSIGARLAKVNVAILLGTWIVVFTCDCMDVSALIQGAIAVVGVLGALFATTSLLRWNLGVRGWVGWRMGMLSFAGGNLPIFLLVVAILALL